MSWCVTEAMESRYFKQSVESKNIPSFVVRIGVVLPPKRGATNKWNGGEWYSSTYDIFK